MKRVEEILVSVVIPVKNGDLWIGSCLKGIASQSLFEQVEIIVVDSGSTDNSLGIIKNFPVQLYTIPPDEFNHGLTRNLATKFCSGKYVVMTVQDAVPADNHWLEKLLKEFSDESVAGVCGMQIVAHDPDKNPLSWYRPVSKPSTRRFQFATPEDFEKLSPLEKKSACSWDNVTAMYRRDILLQIPFVKTVFGEDMIWARQALQAGFTLVYNPMAGVYHYHTEDAEYTFKRTLTTYYFRYKEFGLKPNGVAKTWRQKLGLIKNILQSKGLRPGKKWYWWKYNVESQKAMEKAFRIFSNALMKGEPELDRIHELYCSKPPVPVRKK